MIFALATGQAGGSNLVQDPLTLLKVVDILKQRGSGLEIHNSSVQETEA